MLDTISRFLLHLAVLASLKGAEKVAARRTSDQVYRRRCCSDAAARSTENANFKQCRQESRQRSAADNYKAALIDVSVDTTPNVTIMLPCWRRPVVRPHRRAAAVRSAAALCYKRIAVDQAGIRITGYTMCCCFRTAPTAFTWTSRGRRGKVGHRYGILLLLATDAARRPSLNIVLCGDRLFQQYVVNACAKMEQQRLNYLRFNQNSFRTWRCSGEWRRLRRSSSAQFYTCSL